MPCSPTSRMDGELWTDCHQRRHWGGTRGWCRGELGKRGGSREEKKDRAGQCLKKEIAVKTTHTQPRNNKKHEKEGSEGRSEAGEGEASARLCVGRLCRLGELYTPLITPPDPFRHQTRPASNRRNGYTRVGEGALDTGDADRGPFGFSSGGRLRFEPQVHRPPRGLGISE